MKGITLKLDSEAMNSLFPEGSEARVDLQKAVISNFIKRNADLFLKQEIKDIMENEAKTTLKSEITDLDTIAREALQDYVEKSWAGFNLKDKGLTKLRQEAKDIVRSQISTILREEVRRYNREAIQEIVRDAKEKMPHYLQKISQDDWRHEVNLEAKRLLNEAIKE